MNSPTQRIVQVLGRPIASLVGSILLGVFVFWLTNNPVAGALFPAARAGWEAFRSAWWILHADPNATRGRICSAFCLATAFWQAATAMFVSVVVFVTVANLGGGAPDMKLFAVTMTTLACGLALTSLLGLVATFAAVYSGIRVWVHPRMRMATGQNVDSIAGLPQQRFFNYVVFVLGTSMALPPALIFAWLAIEPRPVWIAVAIMVVAFVVPIAGYGWFAKRIVANDPTECWN